MQEKSIKEINIYTDGSYDIKYNVGGWAFVIPERTEIRKVSDTIVGTTGNRIELIAVNKSLEYVLKNYYMPDVSKINIYTDSEYVNMLKNEKHNYLMKWKQNNFKRETDPKQDIANKDLLIATYSLLTFACWDKVNIIKVKAHNNIALNEIADRLANERRIDGVEGIKKNRH